MSVLSPGDPDSTENWDDDFEFNQNNNERHEKSQVHDNTRRSTKSTQFNEDWDDEQTSNSTPLSKDRKNVLKPDNSLLHWAEPGPSTPSKRPVQTTENWDDDFQDRIDSPLRQHHTANDVSPRSRRSRMRPLIPESENWDDEFEKGGKVDSPSGKSARWSSSSSDEEFAFGEREDDRTVTSRSRRAPLRSTVSPAPGDTPPPPVPPIPSALLDNPAPFPRSPTASVFSVPTVGRDSYSSTAHLALRPTLSGSGSSFAGLPPSPPIHRERERRRLRKKSRPPRMEDNIYELDDRIAAEADESVSILHRRPVTPERRSPLPPSPAPIDTALPSTSPPTKSSLVSRIGSVGKKWGAARKKRVSTGPAEVSLQEHDTAHAPRPPSVAGAASPTSRTGWFFRHGGGASSGSGSPPTAQHQLPLKHEKSVDRLLSMVGVDPDSPSRRKQKTRQTLSDLPTELQDLSTRAQVDDSAKLLFGAPRRPTSMAVPSTSSQSGIVEGVRTRVPRHASYGQTRRGRDTPSSRSSSKGRSASASVEDLGRTHHHSSHGKDRDRSVVIQEHEKEEHHHGHRSFMGGMRRISLGGKHKRTKSSAAPSQDDHERIRPSTSTSATAVPSRIAPSDGGNDTTPRPPSRVMRLSIDMEAGPSSRKSRPNVEDNSLLPPIELQPPSPPRRRLSTKALDFSPSTSSNVDRGIDTLLNPLSTKVSLELPSSNIPSSTSSPFTTVGSSSSPLPSPTRPKPPSSPQQAASLGRSTQPPKERDISVNGSAVPRRNSLGDLKIPTRISQAQVGLKRDLTMVRDFAASVEQLKQLQATYHSLVTEVQTLLISTSPPDPPSQSRAISPTLFHLPRPGSRARSNTNPQTSTSSAHATNQASNHRHLTSAFHSIDSKYRISWECAELLIELGGGPVAESPTSPPPICSSQSASAVPPPDGSTSQPHGRERAITLAGDEPKPHFVSSNASGNASSNHHGLGSPPLASPPNPVQWRASTGRHDLSQRQLVLLREMLNGPDTSSYHHPMGGLGYHIPEEEVNRAWRWGDAMNSTVTLPSEESSHLGSASGSAGVSSGAGVGKASPIKKRRSSRLGMRGLRDMLKSLKKTYSEHPAHTHTQPHHHHPDSLPTAIASGTSPPILQSLASVSASTDSSLNLPSESHHGHAQHRPYSLVQRRRAKTSIGPESTKSLRGDRHPNSPYGTSPSLIHKSSPRRPSLASIFRLGQKNKNSSSSTPASASPHSNSGHDLSAEDVPHGDSSSSGHICASASHGTEEDWAHVDSASDLDLAAKVLGVGDGAATVRGKKVKGRSPYSLHQQHPLHRERSGGFPETPRRTPNPSQSSIWGGDSPQKSSSSFTAQQAQSPSSVSGQAQSYSRSIKLSNVQELVEKEGEHHVSERQSRHPSASSKAGRRASGVPSPSPKRPASRSGRRGTQSGSVRSAPPQTWMSQGHGYSPELQSGNLPTQTSLALAMTPENIKPLLENAREVHARCSECIGELRGLLAARRLVD